MPAARFGPGWPDVWRGAGVDPVGAMVAYATTWITLLWVLGLYRLRHITDPVRVYRVARAELLARSPGRPTQEPLLAA